LAQCCDGCMFLCLRALCRLCCLYLRSLPLCVGTVGVGEGCVGAAIDAMIHSCVFWCCSLGMHVEGTCLQQLLRTHNRQHVRTSARADCYLSAPCHSYAYVPFLQEAFLSAADCMCCFVPYPSPVVLPFELCCFSWPVLCASAA
jgi:hypothetical protein